MPDTKIRASKATALLREDHRRVKHLLLQYERLGDKASAASKKKLFLEIEKELTIHASIEEEIFYPAIRDLKDDSEDAGDLVAEAREEHKIVKTLLEEIASLAPGDEAYDAKMKVLTESVRHHAQEEEEDMLPLFEDLSKERQLEVSERLMERKDALGREYEEGS